MPRQPPSPPPDAASLRQAALRYVARYAANSQRLRRVLEARLTKAALQHPEWASDTARRGALQQTITQLVQECAKKSYIDDAGYAAGKARQWGQQGKSRRAIAARLQAEGCTPADIAAALPSDDAMSDETAARRLAQRKRLGPYRKSSAASPDQQRREYAAFARAGFSHELARKILNGSDE
jgi:regulatory protein